MTREEAVKSMEYSKAQAEITLSKGVTQYWKQEINWTIEAIDMAIEALKGEDHDGCDGCRYEANDEYMTPCNKCKQNYKDEYKPMPKHGQSADRPIGEQYKKGFEDAKRAFLVEYARESENMRKRNAQLEVMLNAQKAISADRPRGEWTLLAEERPVDDYEIIATVYWPGDGDSIIAVGHIDRFDNWHLYSPTEGELIKGFEVIAWKTLPEPYKESDAK